MNPYLSEQIAKEQRIRKNHDVLISPNIIDIAEVNELVGHIALFKLGSKVDNNGERTGYFTFKDQAKIVEELQPSNDQRQFLNSVTLKLRVMSAPSESPNARALDLLCYADPDSRHFSNTLFGTILVIPAIDTEDHIPIIDIADSGPLLPGMPEFEDIRTLVFGATK